MVACLCWAPAHPVAHGPQGRHSCELLLSPAWPLLLSNHELVIPVSSIVAECTAMHGGQALLGAVPTPAPLRPPARRKSAMKRQADL